MQRQTITQAGAIIIGDEILSSYRQDAHMPYLLKTFPNLGISLKRVAYVGDSPKELHNTLKCSRSSEIPVFCFGGIGATEDDRTRQIAAQVFNRPITRHPEAEKMIRNRFGEESEPYRIRMADLPKGCDLIPNPASQIPGFYHDNHYFMPGFPNMAQTMISWILTNILKPPGHKTVTVTSHFVNCKESQLVPIMESLTRKFPMCSFFSLPSTDCSGLIELGFRSSQPIPAALTFMEKLLKIENIPWSKPDN
ncbi:MAG: competence/damage-inducible protein A [Magnetococcales bacterium]|nr:competence/damage-inducible protein A [Magnetococcales bacterium]